MGRPRGPGGQLGGLPLALEQAAAYVQASGDSLAGYLALFRRRRADMLARGAAGRVQEDGSHRLALAFEDLQHAAPGAAGLLRLLAFCAPEAIPLRLLLQPRPGLAGQLGPEVAPCWCRCWRTSWRPGTRSWRCAAIRWSPRPETGRSPCIGWCRLSPRLK